MMRVRITQQGGYVNTLRGLALRQGEVAELDDALAVKLLKHRIAIPVRETVVETAAIEAPERTVRRPRKRKSTS